MSYFIKKGAKKTMSSLHGEGEKKGHLQGLVATAGPADPREREESRERGEKAPCAVGNEKGAQPRSKARAAGTGGCGRPQALCVLVDCGGSFKL